MNPFQSLGATVLALLLLVATAVRIVERRTTGSELSPLEVVLMGYRRSLGPTWLKVAVAALIACLVAVAVGVVLTVMRNLHA